jgi:SWI/SNF-related matrix-associated actin-dependent regulator 1 of chromatin subfamily A
MHLVASVLQIGPAREYVSMLCENSNLKFLVFAYHHSMIDGLQQTLWDKKVKFVRIDGHTKPSERQVSSHWARV